MLLSCLLLSACTGLPAPTGPADDGPTATTTTRGPTTGPTTGTASSSLRLPAHQLSGDQGARPRQESDAYVETAVAATAAVLTSVDGGDKDLLAPATIADLALRATAAGASTATNVALIRVDRPAFETVDLAAIYIPDEGGGVVLTLRF